MYTTKTIDINIMRIWEFCVSGNVAVQLHGRGYPWRICLLCMHWGSNKKYWEAWCEGEGRPIYRRFGKIMYEAGTGKKDFSRGTIQNVKSVHAVRASVTMKLNRTKIAEQYEEIVNTLHSPSTAVSILDEYMAGIGTLEGKEILEEKDAVPVRFGPTHPPPKPKRVADTDWLDSLFESELDASSSGSLPPPKGRSDEGFHPWKKKIEPPKGRTDKPDKPGELSLEQLAEQRKKFSDW